MQLIIGTVGLILMAISFHRHSDSKSAVFAIAVGLYWLFFYLYCGYFVEISDPVLILMTAAACPPDMSFGNGR